MTMHVRTKVPARGKEGGEKHSKGNNPARAGRGKARLWLEAPACAPPTETSRQSRCLCEYHEKVRQIKAHSTSKPRMG